MSLDPKEFAELKRKTAIYDRHALLIGQVNMVWNDVQTEIFLMFRELSGMPWASADAVFFAVRTDAAQRDMTSALAKQVLSNKPEALKETLQLINEIGLLAGQRNAAIHTAWIVEDGSELPKPYLRLNTPKALKDNSLAQFEKLRSDLLDLFLALARHRNSGALVPTSPEKARTPKAAQEASLGANAPLSVPQSTPHPPQSADPLDGTLDRSQKPD